MEHKNPWLTIWTQPRATIAQIVRENPNRSLWWLAAIYGFSSLLGLFQSMALGTSVGLVGIVLLAIIFSAIYGYIGFAIWSAFVLWVGKLFKGHATFKTIRASYAWSCVPVIVNIPLWVLVIVLFGQQVFMNFQNAGEPSVVLFFLFFILAVKVIVAIWSLVIFINALAEVQKYSILRSIGNILVAGIILGIVFFALWSLLLYSFGGVVAG